MNFTLENIRSASPWFHNVMLGWDTAAWCRIKTVTDEQQKKRLHVIREKTDLSARAEGNTLCAVC